MRTGDLQRCETSRLRGSRWIHLEFERKFKIEDGDLGGLCLQGGVKTLGCEWGPPATVQRGRAPGVRPTNLFRF